MSRASSAPTCHRLMFTLADGSRDRAALAPLAPFFPEWQVYFAPMKTFQQGLITAVAADGSTLLRAGFRPGMDCTDGSMCGVGAGPGETIAESSDASSPYRLVEMGGNIELQDDIGTTLASVPVRSDLLALRSAHVGGQRRVLFGVAPSATAIVVQDLPWPEGWDLTQWARLRDGTVVFWSQTSPGDSAPARSPPSTRGAIHCRRSIATLRPSLRPIDRHAWERPAPGACHNKTDRLSNSDRHEPKVRKASRVERSAPTSPREP